MKINSWKHGVYLCLIFGWTGCSSEMEPLSGTGQQEVVFHITQEEGVGTKAALTGFETGDSIGIYAVKRTDPEVVALPGQTGNQAHNAKWVKTAEGWEPATLADKIVFPHDGGKLDFYAYYPYRADSRNPEDIPFTVQSDQTTEAARKMSDFMKARNTTGISEGAVDLTFSHALAMAEVRVKAGDNVTLEAGLKVQMRGVAVATSLNLATWTLTPSTGTGIITMARQEEAENVTSFTFRGYVPAQEVQAEKQLFNCSLNGSDYIYKSEGTSLTAGKRTPFQLTLK